MKTTNRLSAPVLVVALTLLAVVPALAQQHRATRLGNPETRFAPPLTNPEQLRTLLTSDAMKADVESILEQGGYRGDLGDFRRAAASNEIYEIKIHPGTIMPYMSARKRGKPVALKEVLWAGKEPVEAYAFLFTSQGRRYRCVTPKPCSNFYHEDLGPIPPPTLRLTKVAPVETTVCSPFEVVLSVANEGRAPLTGVRVTDELPPGLKAVSGNAVVTWDAGTLAPGVTREHRFQVQPTAAGPHVNVARAVSAEGGRAEASASTTVRAPVLAVDCVAPERALLGRPIEVCLTVRNTGDTNEPKAVLRLPVPEGATVVGANEGGVASPSEIVWELGGIEGAATKTVCAVFKGGDAGRFDFLATATGTCVGPVEAKCATQVAGIPAILLEVVDLEDPVTVGEQVTYEIRVTNQGSAPGTNIRLVCTLPENQEFVSGSGETTVSAQGRTVEIAAVPTLAPKAQVAWRVVVKALAAGDTRFDTQLTSDQFTRPIEEIEATTQY